MRYFFLSILLTASTGWGWAGHYAVTAAALDRRELKDFLDTKVKVERIEDFLKAEKAGVAATIGDFYTWLKTTGAKRFKAATFDTDHPTVESFLKATRLYPKTKFRYLHRVLPGEKVTGPLIAFNAISPTEKLDKNFATGFQEQKDTVTTNRTVLFTYADEPDWLIDYNLWSFPAYGYGEKPYGKANDPSSGAPFHMQFSHENFLIRKLVAGIEEGMASERLELFIRLSRLAYSTNHPYWGSRFAAWAFHYIQDMSQPYHAKAVPSETWGYYLNFALSSDKPKIVADTTQLVANRHLLYEDFVRGLLEKQYVTPNELSRRVYGALNTGDLKFDDVAENEATGAKLFTKISAISAAAAYSMDAAVQAAYGKKLTGDPTYNVELDPAYDNQAIYREPSQLEPLMKEAMSNLPVAAKGTRTVLAICRGRSS